MALAEPNPESKDELKLFDEQTDRRIHEHLSNEFDVISEDDIRNIKTSIEDGEAILEEPDVPIVEYSGENKLNDDLNPDIGTNSWGILDS